MSEIEPSLVRKSALWKVSGTNKIGHIEQSRISPSFRLPEKFSPSKGGLNDSRLFNSSIEKVRLSKINSPKDNVLTPKKATVSSQMFSSHEILKDSEEIKQSSPLKSPSKQKIGFKSKELDVSISEEQLKTIRQQMKKELINQYQHNRKLIYQLKEDFSKFKASVLSDIVKQQNQMSRIVEEITKQLKIERLKASQQFMKSLGDKQDQIKQQLSQKQQSLNRVEKLTFQLSEVEKIEMDPEIEKSPLQSPLCKHASSTSKKDSPDIQKFQKIVETVNTLNQINDSPIDRPKSVEKMLSKEKILVSAKSNSNLWKNKVKKSEITSEITKAKTNHKFDKFYSAIEKLKGEVSDIMHFSEMKYTKNGRLIKECQ